MQIIKTSLGWWLYSLNKDSVVYVVDTGHGVTYVHHKDFPSKMFWDIWGLLKRTEGKKAILLIVYI